jgi:hypothetical protein
LPLLYRDVFILDDGWDETRFVAGVQAGSPPLKHPNSGHAVSAYADWLFQHSNYHFNTVGEFSLNISAAHLYHPRPSAASRGHSVLFWPEQLLLKGLSSSDVPAVVKAALSTSPTSAVELKSKLSSTASVEAMPALVVVSACGGSPGFSAQRAGQTLSWFKTAASEGKHKDIMLLQAEDLKNHRSGTNVIIMPRAEKARELAFELQLSLSLDRVRAEMDKL